MGTSGKYKTMEKNTNKERLMLVAGLALCAALLGAHYLSPIATGIGANRDVEIVLLGESRKIIFVYHSFSGTVSAITLPAVRALNRGSALQKAGAALALYSGKPADSERASYYLEVQDPVSAMEKFYETLNLWRSRPALFVRAAAALWRATKEERTNIPFYGLAALALEMSRLNSSDFIVGNLDRTAAQTEALAAAQEQPPGEAAPEAPRLAPLRVEILNASGKKDLASQVTRFLRKKGFDVINYGTYTGAGKQTKIVNCSRSLESARTVRAVLGLNALEIHTVSGSDNVAEVSVVLGTDFKQEFIKE
jgi:hypothetical protein